MKTYLRNLTIMRCLLSLGVLLLLVQGCKKNEDFIVEEAVPLNLGIRLSVDEGDFIYDAYGRYCEADGELVIVVANNPALLMTDVPADQLESGDFVLFRVGNDAPGYGLLYVYQTEEGGVVTTNILVGEPDSVTEFVVEPDLIQGEVSGEFVSTDASLVVPFAVTFTTQLIEEPTLCD